MRLKIQLAPSFQKISLSAAGPAVEIEVRAASGVVVLVDAPDASAPAQATLEVSTEVEQVGDNVEDPYRSLEAAELAGLVGAHIAHRENVEFKDGSSLKRYASKGVSTRVARRDLRRVRQLYPEPEGCVVVSRALSNDARGLIISARSSLVV